MTLDKNSLTLEKINADRIGRLEEKFDRFMSDLPKIIEHAVGKRPDPDASWVRQSIGLTLACVTLLGFFVSTMVAVTKPIAQQVADNHDQVKEHDDLFGHSGVLSKVATLEANLKEVETQFRGAEKLMLRIESNIKDNMININEKIENQIGSHCHHKKEEHVGE